MGAFAKQSSSSGSSSVIAQPNRLVAQQAAHVRGLRLSDSKKPLAFAVGIAAFGVNNQETNRNEFQTH